MGVFETVGNDIFSRSIAKWDGDNWIPFMINDNIHIDKLYGDEVPTSAIQRRQNI